MGKVFGRSQTRPMFPTGLRVLKLLPARATLEAREHTLFGPGLGTVAGGATWWMSPLTHAFFRTDRASCNRVRVTPETDSTVLTNQLALQEALLAVHDLMHAERAIEAMRLAS